MSMPLVAIFMVTYNHEKYIGQAIESVLMQKTNFSYKLFIGEDLSTDITREIVRKYELENPESIKVYYNDQNLGGMNNARQIYQACFASGAEYIAMLEGDDYWTDPLKLQKQVNFLEKNNEFSCCAHYSNTKYETAINSGGQFYKASFKNDGVLRKNDFMAVNKFHTSSLLIRNKNIAHFLDDGPITLRDNPLKIKLLQFGPIKVLPFTMSTYRKNPGGMSENVNIRMIYETEIDTATVLGKELNGFFFKSRYIKSHWHRYYLINASEINLFKKLELFFKFLIPSFYNFPRNLIDIASTIYNGFLR